MLSIVSIVFNLTFVIQHYCLYRGNEPPPEEQSIIEEERAMLDGVNRTMSKDKNSITQKLLSENINATSGLTASNH